MSDKDRLFCSRPFSWFEVSRFGEAADSTRTLRGGDTFLCCPSWLTKPVGNLLQSSVDEIWNGETAREIRKSILDGSFKYCNHIRCPFLQNRTFPVQPVDRVVDPLMRRAIDENLTVLPWGPLEINACFDQSCNLSCPSCRTRVIMEHDRHDEITLIKSKLNREALKHARLLYITGSGDPFGSPFFRQWLQTLRREDVP